MKQMLLAAAILAASAAAHASDSVLATINGQPLTSKEMVEQFSKRHGGHARFLGGMAEARQFLDALIDQRLFVQEAYEIGLDQDADVAASVKEFAESKASELLVRREITDKSRVTPAEVREVWRKNLDVILELRQIAVDTEEEALSVRSALLHGADFETLARSCSRAPSRAHGGHLRVNWGQADEAWEAAVFALEPGELSQPIATPGGYEIVIVDQRASSMPPPFEKFSGDIEAVLSRRKLEHRKLAFSQELWAKYHVVLPVDVRTSNDVARLLATAPQTVIASWDGGTLTAAQTFAAADVAEWRGLSPRTVSLLIAERIRATVNSPIAVLEANARKLAADAEIAPEIAVYRETAMQKKLFAEHVLKDVSVTEAEARAYYDAHHGEFEEPEQRAVSHILVTSEKDAAAVRERLAGGADFAATAKKFSRDFQSAAMDGSLGWITPDKVPPAFAEVLTLGRGELSKPIASASGWHIIKVTDIKPKRQQPFEEVRDKATARATFEKQQAAQKFWLQKLRASAAIVYHDAAIKQFVKANQFDANAAPPQHSLQ